jgi:hypothetical protein
VCIVTVDLHTGTLTAANVGDSGFMVVRGAGRGTPELLYRSEQQEHEFGRPFQLGHHEAADSPGAADQWSTTVQVCVTYALRHGGLGYQGGHCDTATEKCCES